MKNCDLDKNGNTVYLKYEFYYLKVDNIKFGTDKEYIGGDVYGKSKV